MIDISEISHKKARQTGHPQGKWQRVIEQAATFESINRLTDGEFETFAAEALSPEIYQDLAKLFEERHRNHPDLTSGWDCLIAEVDESAFALSDWLTGLSSVSVWASQNGISTDFANLLGYVKCCAMSTSGDSAGSLPETVEQMLAEQGFEGLGPVGQ